MTKIGRTMQAARLEAGLDVLDLSVRSGVSEGTIRHYESGYTKFRQLENIIALADVMGLTLDEFVGHRVKDRQEDLP